MSFSDFELELRGVRLPEKEAYLDDLTAEQIVCKINQFHERLRHESHLQVAPFAESYFLNLIALYPVSMCCKSMTDSLKLVAALFYVGSQPKKEKVATGVVEDDQRLKEFFPRNKPSLAQRGYSFEDLALIFERNKGAIAEAVREKQEEAKIILEEAALRCQRQSELPQSELPALETLTEEEKHKLVVEKTKFEERKRTSLSC